MPGIYRFILAVFRKLHGVESPWAIDATQHTDVVSNFYDQGSITHYSLTFFLRKIYFDFWI